MLVESKELEKLMARCRRRILFVGWLKSVLNSLIILLFSLIFVELLGGSEVNRYLGLYLPVASALAIFPVFLRKWPSHSMIAQRVDRMLYLEQRLETAWETRKIRSDLVQYLLKDTLALLGKSNPVSLFPVRWSQTWLLLPPLLLLYFISVYQVTLFSFYPHSSLRQEALYEYLREGSHWQQLIEKAPRQGQTTEDEDKELTDLITRMKAISNKMLSSNHSLSEILQELNHLREQVRYLQNNSASLGISDPGRKDQRRMQLENYLAELNREIDESKRRLTSGSYAQKERSDQGVKTDFLLDKFPNISNQESRIDSFKAPGRGSGAEAGSGKSSMDERLKESLTDNTGDLETNRSILEKDTNNPLLIRGDPQVAAIKGRPIREVEDTENVIDQTYGDISRNEISEMKTSQMEQFNTRKLIQVDARRVTEEILPTYYVPPHLRTYIRDYFLLLADIKKKEGTMSSGSE